MDDYYLGRSDQEKELSRYLSKPKRNVPVASHIVGHYGVGRKTFLRRSLQALAPRQYTSLIPIDLREYDGVIELYRKLYEYTEIYNNIVAGEKFAEFNKMTDKEKSAEIARQIKQLMDADCLLLIIDEGGVYQDIGDYREYFPELLSHLGDVGRPAISFIQTRMMREFYKSKYLRSAHIRVPSLPDDVVYELMCLLLNEFDVEYTEEEARQACSLTDGHPYNIHFIAAYIKGEGIDVALADPAEIIERKFEISQKFIRGIAFSDLEADIVAVLHEYRFCEIEFILFALNRSGAEVVEAVRRLEDFCCLERRDRVLLISPPLRDAIRRDKRFSRDEEWKTEVAERVIKGLESYQAEDNVPLSLIDTAIPELIRTGRSIPFVTALILPSHFLRVARDYYDRRNWTRSAEFCEKALDLDSQLSMDAKVEANRLLGLARTRIDPEDTKITDVIGSLRRYGTATARRVAFFMEGFRARRRGNYEEAEEKFLQASELDRENYHINRELSWLLCRTERYSEAEPYARAAHRRSPDNPYILDVLIEAMEGRASQGQNVDRAELQRLYLSLESACQTGNCQFFAIREAKQIYSQGQDKSRAIVQMDKAVEKSSDKGDAFYHRGEMYIRSNTARVREDIRNLRALNDKEARRSANVLEVNCLIAEGQFVEAKKYLDNNFSSSPRIVGTLEMRLARAIGFSPSGQPEWLQTWAKKVGR